MTLKTEYKIELPKLLDWNDLCYDLNPAMFVNINLTGTLTLSAICLMLISYPDNEWDIQ